MGQGILCMLQTKGSILSNSLSNTSGSESFRIEAVSYYMWLQHPAKIGFQPLMGCGMLQRSGFKRDK